jgi:hypothetical protein
MSSNSDLKTIAGGVVIGTAIGFCIGTMFYREKIHKATEEFRDIENGIYRGWNTRAREIYNAEDRDMFYNDAHDSKVYDKMREALYKEKSKYNPLLNRFKKIIDKLNK